MINDCKILLIYRDSDFYKDILEFISCFTDIVNYEVSLHNFTKDKLDETIYTKIVNYDMSESESSVSDTIKFFYNDNLDNYCLVFDSCIKYNKPINIGEFSGEEEIFIRIQADKCDSYFILGKKIQYNKANILFDYEYNYSNENSILSGSINSKFLHNFNSSTTLNTCILDYILDIDIDKDELDAVLGVDCEGYYKGFLKLLLRDHDSESTNHIELIFELFESECYGQEVLFILLRILNDSPILHFNKEEYTIILDKIEALVKDVTDFSNLLRLKTSYDTKECIDFIIKTNIKASFTDIYTIPGWVHTDNDTSIVKYYPTLTCGEIIKISYPYKINNNMTLLSKGVYGLDDNILNIKQDRIIFNEDEMLFENKNGISVLYSDEMLYLYTQANPIIIYSISQDNKLDIVEDGIFNYGHEEYTLIGNIVSYMNLYMGVMKVKNGSYRLLILDTHMLDCVEITRNFNITSGEVIGLVVENNKLYVIGELTDNDIEVYKQEICSEILFLDLTSIFNLKPSIELKINDKNNVYLEVPGWDYEPFVYNNFIFSRSKDNDIKASYDHELKLLSVDGKMKYTKEFIYLPNTLDISEKTHELYFHESTKETLLYDKSEEFNISISDNYLNAKYLVIDQSVFESLGSLELSNIISSNTLIISLIDSVLLSSNSLVNNYTTSKLLTKLFLFNIVKNQSYVEFIFDKIIHKGEYNDRKNFINIDKEHIFNQSSIYKNVLELYKAANNIDIQLSEKDESLCKLIKSKILNKVDPSIYKSILNIIKFIIKKNHNASILFNKTDINKNQIIFKIFNKVNWLGNSTISVTKKDMKFDIIVINTQKELIDVKLKDEGLIYILEPDILLKM